ncbi:thioesterase family protein [Candidatus Sulfidibacterium hydrothermale]|uniref:thioesterase family protein n=1 Tax=Candidatus Sulfidibacterium hydrothermale TaxID=2875962 RepID=UPI001F0AF090|nr:thioesterase family protein [Candidatus Sulfidibacterium hydrothermale]UBM61848.1 thioesterase family protein [Candidatus Sulfidibacterium hydrothermale]
MFQKKLKTGLTYEKTIAVTSNDTAAAYGSGNVDVLATPAMIALMEGTALECVQSFLEKDFVTVGIDVCVKHVKATPVGMQVTCKAILREVDGARLVFDVEAWDEKGKIGMGTHERFVVNLPEFMKKVNQNG